MIPKHDEKNQKNDDIRNEQVLISSGLNGFTVPKYFGDTIMITNKLLKNSFLSLHALIYNV